MSTRSIDVTHDQKISRLIAEARQKGVGSRAIAPPLFRWLWAMGVQIPPPLFLRFVSLAVLMGIMFAVPFMVVGGFLLWLVFWQGVPFAEIAMRMLFMGLFAGILYGLYV